MDPHPTIPYIFLSTSKDGTTKIWDLKNKTLVQTYEKSSLPNLDKKPSINDAKWSFNGMLASVDDRGYLKLYGPESMICNYEYTPWKQTNRNDQIQFNPEKPVYIHRIITDTPIIKKIEETVFR